MGFLGTIFFGYLGVLALVACLRCGRVAVRMINSWFDKLDDRFRK